MFRTSDGEPYRIQKSIFNVDMTDIVDRIQLFFISQSHVFGDPAADTILPHHSLYVPLMTIIVNTTNYYCFQGTLCLQTVRIEKYIQSGVQLIHIRYFLNFEQNKFKIIYKYMTHDI